MGCSGCTKSNGCEAEKGPQRVAIDAVLSAIYPRRTWGDLDDEARFRAGISPREVRRLQRALAVATKTPSFLRSAPEDLCEFVYLLCVGRVPSLLDVRDGLFPPEGNQVKERYLRVALSSIGRLATVQEVAMELAREDGIWVVRERPQPGVYDPVLLKRLRAVVDLVEAHDIEHLDFGLLEAPPPNFAVGEYPAQYGTEPVLANYLFFSAPTTSVSLSILKPSDPLPDASDDLGRAASR
jgi:hypothetical protein